MESNNSIEELIIRYLQNEIQEDELRTIIPWSVVGSEWLESWMRSLAYL